MITLPYRVFLGIGLAVACCAMAGGSAHAGLPARHSKTTRSQEPKLDYLRDIRPILAANCFACHGRDEKKRQAGLRLDIPESAYGKTAMGHTAVVPGKLQSSALYARITDRTALRMPPEKSGKKLT